MNKKLLLMFSGAILILVSCISHDVEFDGRTVIGSDGSIRRSGELRISLSGERDVEKDLSNALEFYGGNFVLPDTDLFEIQQTFADSVLTVSWIGEIHMADLPISDYTHRAADGSAAGNKISLVKKRRWFFDDYHYVEVFSDPVDTVEIFPLLQDRLSKASDHIMNLEPMKSLKDRQRARDLLAGIETEAGVDLFRAILANPRQMDSLSDEHELYVHMVADSLAGFAGVKLNPDSLVSLLGSVYDAVWDTLFTNHPGIFGSYRIGEAEKHRFRIEVSCPGCIASNNADSTFESAAIWTFDHLDFFAREKTMELACRIWSWGNVAITVAVILILLVVILWPIRRKGFKGGSRSK
jgi:hypothetical protein